MRHIDTLKGSHSASSIHYSLARSVVLRHQLPDHHIQAIVNRLKKSALLGFGRTGPVGEALRCQCYRQLARCATHIEKRIG